MGQKVNPISYRLQISKDWSSKWFTRKSDFRRWLVEDDKIRKVIEERFKSRPTIARINIERSANLTTITILTAKAGAVIGKQGAGINELKKEVEHLKKESRVIQNIYLGVVALMFAIVSILLVIK